jgi:phosphomannomutase
MDTVDQSIFKSYDIRGIYPSQLNEEIAAGVAKGFVSVIKPETVILGRDCRLSGLSLHDTIVKTLTGLGVNVIDVGQLSSDMYYFACATKKLPGIMITASHNPKEYNGFKMVKQIPYFLTGDDEIRQIKEMIVDNKYPEIAFSKNPGKVEVWNVMPEFLQHVLSLIFPDKLKPIKVIADTGNGMVGPIIKALAPHLNNISFTEMFFDPDGNFPNHGGDPLQPENRVQLEAAVTKENADLGVMFDTDGDRFFVLDKKGRFIPGDFMTAILSEYFLKKAPGAAIVYDIRASKVVADTIIKLSGKPLYNRVGHSYIKKRMTEENAIFGGEVTGHYYFTSFFKCDSGVVTLVYLIDFLSQTDKTLDQIVDQMEADYHISGEINSKVASVPDTLEKIENTYKKQANEILHIDGVSAEFDDWRFNVRGSNTEPLIRLNLEAKDVPTMEKKRDEVLALIRS